MSTAYGQITIVDMTDVGQFSITPMANHNAFVKDGDTGNYDFNTVTLDAVVYYGATRFESVTTGANLTSVVWKNSSGTVVANGLKQTINISNIFPNSYATSGTLTVEAKYIDPNDNTITLDAAGSITFTRYTTPATRKEVKITGNNVFKINEKGTIIGDNGVSTITLDTSSSVGIADRANITWTVNGENKGKGATLTITRGSVDTYVVKASYSETIYDVFTITTLRDGASSEEILVLANGYTNFAIKNENGSQVPVSGAFPMKVNTLSMLGDYADMVGYTITAESSEFNFSLNGVDAVLNSSGNYQSSITLTTSNVTKNSENDSGNFSANFIVKNIKSSINLNNFSSGTINFVAVRAGYTTCYQTLVIGKNSLGADASSYELLLSPSTLTINENGSLSSSSIAVTTQKIMGDGAPTKTDYGSLTYKINDGSAQSITRTNGVGSITDLSSGLSKLIVEWKDSNGNLLDTESLIIQRNGSSAISIILKDGNYQIATDSSKKVQTDQTFTETVEVYQGTQKLTGVNITSVDAINGVNWTTTGSNSSIKFSSSTSVFSNESGQITFAVSYTRLDGSSGTGTVTANWSLSKQGYTGAAAQFMVITPLTPTVLDRTNKNVQLRADCKNTTHTHNYVWTYYEYGQGYVAFNGTGNKTATISGNTITIDASQVDTLLSVKCQCGSIEAYQQIIDKGDPIQIELWSSIGKTIKNGKGIGGVIALGWYTDGGTTSELESDLIFVDNYFRTSKSSTTNINDKGKYFYYLDNATNPAAPKAKLFKYNTDGSVSEPSHTYSCNYVWQYTNEQGNIITTVNGKTLQTDNSPAIYIDGGLINSKITINCKVTK